MMIERNADEAWQNRQKYVRNLDYPYMKNIKTRDGNI